jgi:6-pyruvoyltetrahydropterin/6-carboxytetrahydropterin synthase
MRYFSTKVIELGSAAFRQPRATSHCKFIHGYRLTGKFIFTAETLDSNNWVVDFGNFDQLKSFFEETFDHKLIVAADDPALKEFKALEKTGAVDLVIMKDGVGIEMFAKFCFEAADSYVKNKTDGRVSCYSVEVFEHEKNSAIYKVEDISETEVKVQETTEAVAPKKGNKKAAAEKQVEPAAYKANEPVTITPKQVVTPPTAVPVGGKNRPSTWDFGTKWA